MAFIPVIIYENKPPCKEEYYDEHTKNLAIKAPWKKDHSFGHKIPYTFVQKNIKFWSHKFSL